MVKLRSAYSTGLPLSVTRTVMVYWPTAEIPGVQPNTPLLALIVAPAGAPAWSE